MADKKPLIIISGATGVGKSQLAVMLAQKIGGEIISADSMQVYRGFDIGTAKITKEEMQGIPHHLIDILEPDDEFNIFSFKQLTQQLINEITARGHIPVITGGTGFYIQSVIYDIAFEDETDNKSIRSKLEEMAALNGPKFMHDMLKEIDPSSADAIHQNNVKRVIRAIEFYKENGFPISEHNETMRRNRSSPYNFAYFVLERERETVYDRINKRVDQMISDGLVNEVRGLLESGVPADCQAMQGIGYKEIVPYIKGKCTLDEAVYQLKLNTRHFAKRQGTWFRREPDAIHIRYENYDDTEQMLSYIYDVLCSRSITENLI